MNKKQKLYLDKETFMEFINSKGMSITKLGKIVSCSETTIRKAVQTSEITWTTTKILCLYFDVLPSKLGIYATKKEMFSQK